jgi:hypothetical protein
VLPHWWIVGVLAIAGCDGASAVERVPIAGRITLDGAPLEHGTVLFTPASGPRAGGVIRGGRYALDAAEGPPAGELTVEIRAPRLPMGEQWPDDAAERVKRAMHCEEQLPARYNAQTTLRAAATRDGPNQFDFELRSAQQ